MNRLPGSVVLLLLLAAPVAAHQVGADCAVKEDRVEVDAYYSDDTPVRKARVTVRDAGDKVVAEGRTDDKGKFHCRLLPAGLYRVTVDAGPGHKATVRLTVPEGKGAKAPDVAALIARVKATRPEGEGGTEAADAARELIRLDAKALPTLLAALDGANPSASHYLRFAIDQIGEAAQTKKSLPAKELEAFVRDTKHTPRARFLAYEWLRRADSAAPARILGDLLDDPGLELRREAVAAVMKRGADELAAKDEAKATASFKVALASARDRDQVETIVADLGKLGVKIELAAQLGFVRQWLLLGPFDNMDGKGFAAALPPEKAIDLGAAHAGKGDVMLRWKAHATADPFGAVDLNTALVKDKEVVGYALAVVMSDQERPVELRAGSNNAIEIFLNGAKVYSRPFGRQGMRMDQHVGRGTLKAGRNEVLVKVCQDANVRSSHAWGFQLRLCDALGGAVPMTVRAADGLLTPKGVQP